jgi:hypothetical protein
VVPACSGGEEQIVISMSAEKRILIVVGLFAIIIGACNQPEPQATVEPLLLAPTSLECTENPPGLELQVDSLGNRRVRVRGESFQPGEELVLVFSARVDTPTGHKELRHEVRPIQTASLDALPIRFPTTQSGVELKLLARIFALEEAALAALMGSMPEPSDAIAVRAGVPGKVAESNLREMARRGLIRAREENGQACFSLLPFLVGIYKRQLPWMDAELARLFEQYYQETEGSLCPHRRYRRHTTGNV